MNIIDITIIIDLNFFNKDHLIVNYYFVNIVFIKMMDILSMVMLY